MKTRMVDVGNAVIRKVEEGRVKFLALPHDRWQDARGCSMFALPGKKFRLDGHARRDVGPSAQALIDALAQDELGIEEGEYWIDEELPPTSITLDSPSCQKLTDYTIYPVSVGVVPQQVDRVAERLNGRWLTPEQLSDQADLSATTRAVGRHLCRREAELDRYYEANPGDERKPGALKRLLRDVPDSPSAEAVQRRWAILNNGEVRVLRKLDLDTMLAASGRAVNLLVADPYLWYQRQGQGVTWAFFSHRDRQDLHIHPQGVTEFYGILAGELEIWWRPYHASGPSAWEHRILRAGDWTEVGPLQWHIVHWLVEGYGVVFKAGPGPLAGVGRLGTAGKTNWDDSHGVLPREVRELMERLR